MRHLLDDRQQYMPGDNDEVGSKWALDLLRDAALELKAANKQKSVTEAQKDLIAKRNKCFVRTEQVGIDRANNSYWQFDHDKSCCIWWEADGVRRITI